MSPVKRIVSSSEHFPMWAKKRRETKHPIKDEPLPVPGRSLQREIDEYVDTVFWECGGMLILLWCVTILEWSRWMMTIPPSPIFVTMVTLPAMAYYGLRVVRAKSKLLQLKLGLKGELSVGQELQESLPLLGYLVLHDIPGDGFNVDHVAVGPGGVFSIETKTISKPAKGNSAVEYDGKSVKVDGFIPDRDPVVQAAAGARFVSQVLYQQTGIRPAVQPIVVYPGWWVQRSVPRPEVWVLNSKEVPGWIGQERSKLSQPEIKAAVEGLKRHIRSKN